MSVAEGRVEHTHALTAIICDRPDLAPFSLIPGGGGLSDASKCEGYCAACTGDRRVTGDVWGSSNSTFLG